MPEAASALDEARRAHARRDWRAACAAYGSVAQDSLGPDDLVSWSRSAWWLGLAPEGVSLAERAFAGFRAAGRDRDAVDTALRVALLRITKGDVTVGSAWMRRARGLLEEEPDAVAAAHLEYLETSMGLGADSVAWSPASVARLADHASRVPDRTVAALSLVVGGMADLSRGDTARGFARLDEAMLGVLADEIDPEWAGDILCTTIHACYQLADFQRMADWTQATEDWCRQFGSDAVYAGECRVHRLELRSARGDWDAVAEELEAESAALQEVSPWIAGTGWYQLGELRRHRGDHAGAREAFALARDCGIEPVPGEALLELELGDPDRAWALVSNALDARERVARVRLLRAGVEIAIATGDADAAADLAAELRACARDYRSAGFTAWADQADGMVALGRDDALSAVAPLVAAVDYFRRHRQRCELAGALAWLAAAHAATGDGARAEEARGEAAQIYSTLGARARLDVPARPAAPSGPLTAREFEVLEAVAGGASNREAARRLFISEKTVGRHLANIYLKLGVGSRTAAAAWWHQHRGPHAPTG